MPSVDEVARSAKDNLRSSLNITHNLTLSSSSPSDFVLHRMNDVLRAVIDTNFDNQSMDSLGALYAAIGVAQPHVNANAHDLAVIHFSRTFAVALEEAIKMKGKPTGSNGHNNNNNNNNTSGTSDGAWGNAAQGSGSAGRQVSSGSNGGSTTTSQTAGAVQPLKGLQWKPANEGFTGKTAATAAAAPISAVESARSKKKQENWDFSPAAKEGRIRVYKIPTTVTDEELKGVFKQYGDILAFSYPIKQGKHEGYAFLKFKDNATANKVCSQVIKLGDTTLTMDRVKYWFKDDKVPVFGTGRANAGFGSGPGSGKPVSASHQPGDGPTQKSAPSSPATIDSSFFGFPAPLNANEAEKEVVDDEEEDRSNEGGSNPGIC